VPKAAVSVTLDRGNIAWLERHARTTRARSLSQALDDLVTAARVAHDAAAPHRSVAGTIRIAADDPDLRRADAVIRACFAHTLAAPAARRRWRGGRTSRRSTRG
jgi:hypothetical protein